MEHSATASTPANNSTSGTTSVGDTYAAPPVLNLEEEDGVADVTPQPSYQSMSYLVTTPVIQHSGIDRLPSFDKFSTGIIEHIPYENLPNATGVFQKMSGIMKSVQEKMATIRPKRSAKK